MSVNSSPPLNMKTSWVTLSQSLFFSAAHLTGLWWGKLATWTLSNSNRGDYSIYCSVELLTLPGVHCLLADMTSLLVLVMLTCWVMKYL